MYTDRVSIREEQQILGEIVLAALGNEFQIFCKGKAKRGYISPLVWILMCPPPFINFGDASPLTEVIKIYFPPFKKKGEGVQTMVYLSTKQP